MGNRYYVLPLLGWHSAIATWIRILPNPPAFDVVYPRHLHGSPSARYYQLPLPQRGCIPFGMPTFDGPPCIGLRTASRIAGPLRLDESIWSLPCFGICLPLSFM